MNKYVQRIFCFGIVLIFGIVGCSSFEHDKISGPIEPVSQNGAAQLANFFSIDGRIAPTLPGAWPSGQLPRFTWGWKRTHEGNADTAVNAFFVNVPSLGDYLITYRTWIGTFSILVRTSRATSIFVFMHYQDYLYDLSIQDGMITSENVVYEQGSSQVFEQLPIVGPASRETFVPYYHTVLRDDKVDNPFVGRCYWYESCWPLDWPR